MQQSVTALLKAWGRGDLEARDKLIPLVYEDLRRRAAAHLRREGSGHTLQPTALVHEAYFRLAGQRYGWKNRAQFLAVASSLMRRILIDHARRKYADKRGGRRQLAPLEDVASPHSIRLDWIELDESLTALAGVAPEQARLVELRYFGGLTTEETADVLGVSADTVERRWAVARAWLYKRITQGRRARAPSSES